MRVLTVPMRNGNRFFVFAFYWYKLVLTVPMRNGNEAILRGVLDRFQVLTVPMRNGNYIIIYFFTSQVTGSYRTYEEWKPGVDWARIHGSYSSYRTYEEWKLFPISSCFR